MATPVHTPQLMVGLVEDNDDDFWAFDRVFGHLGPVRRWDSAEDALDALAGGDPELEALGVLFVDLNLPGMDGAELVRHVRQLPGGGELRLVVMSSSGEELDIVRALDAGVDEYEVKPDSIADLRLIAGRAAHYLQAA